VDRGTHLEIELGRPDAPFRDVEEVAAFVLLTTTNPGSPDEVRRECQLALGEILFCNSMGIETWRAHYSGEGRWQHILGRHEDSLDDASHCGCQGVGYLVMNEGAYDENALGDIQACDCGVLETDEDAIAAAREDGYIVDDDGLILSEPSRLRGRRRWKA
jgi:hypothetical protein